LLKDAVFVFITRHTKLSQY